MNKDKVPVILAFSFAYGFLAVLAALLFVEVPKESKETVTIMIQALIGIVLTITGYIWGSSSGSKSHSETITKLVSEGEKPSVETMQSLEVKEEK